MLCEQVKQEIKMTIRRVILGSLLLALTIQSSAFAGAEGSGGGNAGTGNLRSVETRLNRVQKILFEENGKLGRLGLKVFLGEISKYPAGGSVHGTLLDLLSKGLIEDIDSSKYVLSDHCYEEAPDTGAKTETDASTIRGERNADICINAVRIAERVTDSSALDGEIAGLLMHEHARHFGLEDKKGRLGMQPVSIFVSDRYDYLWTSYLVQEALEPGTIEKLHQEQAQYYADYYGCYIPRFYPSSKFFVKDAVYVRSRNILDRSLQYDIYTTHPASLRIMINRLSGDCGKNPMKDINDKFLVPMQNGASFAAAEGSFRFSQKSGYFGYGEGDASACQAEIAVETPYEKMILPEISKPASYSGIQYRIHFVDMTDGTPNKKQL